jgi:hypothetical protein
MALDLSNDPLNLFPPKNPKLSLGLMKCPFVSLHTAKTERTILYLSIVKKFWRADGTHDKR